MAPTTTVPSIEMSSGTSIPQLGLGVFQVPQDETSRVVSDALEVGYRSIDTASRYQNEEGVGQALAKSELARDSIFVTTKLTNDDQGYASAHAGFERSMEALGLDTLDLYLIHWPAPARGEALNSWRAMEEIHAAGRVRAIGVANFLPHHLDQLLEAAEVRPAVNQIELHPYLQQKELREYHARHGIVTEAYSPIGRGRVLQDPVILEIARRLGRTAAQVILRWHMQLGNVAIPKSVDRGRIASNFDVFDFELSERDMAAIEGLDRGERFARFHPDTYNGFPEDFERAAPLTNP